MTRMELYQDYIDYYGKLHNALNEFVNLVAALSPLSFSIFCHYCDCGHGTLKIAKTWSYFRELCTSAHNKLRQLTAENPRRIYLPILLIRHFDYCVREHTLYKLCLSRAFEVTKKSNQHIFLNIMEKILLPRVIRELHQICLTSNLNFESFGVHNSNFTDTFIHCLPEGH